MRPFLTAALVCLPLVYGCGQAEPDRYKTKFTERPSKAVAPSSGKENAKEKGPDSGPSGKTITPEKPVEPAKSK